MDNAVAMDTIGNFLFGKHKKEMIERKTRQLERVSGAGYSRLVISRVVLVSFKRRGIAASYGPHQGPQECARRVRQGA